MFNPVPLLKAAILAAALLSHHHHVPPVHQPAQVVVVHALAGDSLSSIASAHHIRGGWVTLWSANADQVPDPNVIRVGQPVKLTGHEIPRAVLLAGLTVPAAPVAVVNPSGPEPSGPDGAPAAPVSAGGSNWVGQLWLAEGGSAATEATAECIAMSESGDRPSATNPSGATGLFQIEPGSGDATTNAAANTASAVALQRARGWEPWVTAAGCGA